MYNLAYIKRERDCSWYISTLIHFFNWTHVKKNISMILLLLSPMLTQQLIILSVIAIVQKNFFQDVIIDDTIYCNTFFLYKFMMVCFHWMSWFVFLLHCFLFINFVLLIVDLRYIIDILIVIWFCRSDCLFLFFLFLVGYFFLLKKEVFFYWFVGIKCNGCSVLFQFFSFLFKAHFLVCFVLCTHFIVKYIKTGLQIGPINDMKASKNISVLQ